MPHADPQKRREYQKAYQAQWRKDNRSKWAEIQRSSDKNRSETKSRIKAISDYRTRRHARQRIHVLQQYGGGKCLFCGDSRYEVLTIDHIHGGGSAHRKEFYGKYKNIYDLLSRTPFVPDTYRVLCWNCHMAMTRYGVMPGGSKFKTFDWWESFSKLRYREGKQ